MVPLRSYMECRTAAPFLQALPGLQTAKLSASGAQLGQHLLPGVGGRATSLLQAGQLPRALGVHWRSAEATSCPRCRVSVYDADLQTLPSTPQSTCVQDGSAGLPAVDRAAPLAFGTRMLAQSKVRVPEHKVHQSRHSHLQAAHRPGGGLSSAFRQSHTRLSGCPVAPVDTHQGCNRCTANLHIAAHQHDA